MTALDEAWARNAAVLPVDPGAPAELRDSLLAAMQPERGADDDVALIVPTSGSTGAPKGAELAAAALQASATATMRRLGLDGADVWLSCLPWHHIGGLQVLLRARQFGQRIVVHDRFDVERVRDERTATLTSLVPAQLVRLLDADVDLSRFRVILLGGAAAPADLLARATAAGANIVTTYGMSETSGGCVYDGDPLDGVDVRLDAEGRIWLRGPMLMSAYRLDPALTSQTLVDGWLRTNDHGQMDADGRLHVLGRMDDVIITGGENVVAGTVESRVRAHPSIDDVVVVGVPDAQWGQRVVAVVASSAVAPTLAELRDWCRGSLPAAALPRSLVVVAALPRLATGKLDRQSVLVLAGQASASTS
jgi:O-succinylbenzoic acid--CoA ligase